MKQAELVERMAIEMGTTKKFAKDALDAVLNGIEGGLAEGEDIKLANFGTFSVKESAARVGRNPATGESIDIPAQNRVYFKASKALKTIVKGG